ncbi:MAG: hypothetical protein AB2792_15485 [Candidatus Thiodiazotropha sp.]
MHLDDGHRLPCTNTIINDGIDFVRETEQRFDVIITDSTDPIGPGSSGGGLFSLWPLFLWVVFHCLRVVPSFISALFGATKQIQRDR